MKKFRIEEITNRTQLEAYMDAIVQNEKSMIPIDVGSDYDVNFMFDRVYTELTADGRYEGAGPWQLMADILVFL